MTIADIPALRLNNQQIDGSEITTPAGIVRQLGAVQAQDFAAAKWALGLRIPGITNDEIDKAFDRGDILRTHLMRPTWHFVVPEDIRWIMELTAPRVNAQCAFINRKMGLDDTIFKKCTKIIVKALAGNKYLTRNELGAVLQKAGVATDDLRLMCIVMRAELDAVICSGPRKGKQFTYALLEERAPKAKNLKKEEALAALAKRYFISHGPAALQDFVWWSGLSTADARAGMEMIKPKLQKEIIEEQTFWYAEHKQTLKSKAPSTYLLPVYDEYIIAYKDRAPVFNHERFGKIIARGNVISGNTIVTDGEVTGTWTRTLTKDRVIIEPVTFIKPTKAQKAAITNASHNYGLFLGLSAELSW